jgi:hypothetical protein
MLLDDQVHQSIHPLTYFRIAQLQSSALFPSLRHLRYNMGAVASIPHIFLFQSPLLDSLELFNIAAAGYHDTIVGSFLATLPSQMLRRIVLDIGQMSVDILKKSIIHLKQIRFLELSFTVSMSDFTLWEVIGSLPFLENFTLKAIDPASHPAHAPENSNSRSGGPKYFDALQTLCVTGSFFLIEHLFGFIDSPWLTTINVFPIFYFRNEREEDPFTPSLTIVASKWSQSLKKLVIDTSLNGTARRHYLIPMCLMLLTDFHEMQILLITGMWMKNHMDDDMRRLAKSWPKLRRLRLPLLQTSISLSTLTIIAENCPELRFLQIALNASPIPPFDTSTSKSLHHKLEVLAVGRFHTTQTSLEFQIKVARCLTLIFPYLKSIEMPDHDNVTWSGIRDLVMLCQDVRRVQ